MLIKQITISGSDKVIKVGTIINNIYLQDADYEITCKVDGLGTIRLKKEFVKKV
jgi:protein PhnA